MEAAFRAVGRVFNRRFPNTIVKQSSTITTTTTTYRSFPRTNPPPSSTSPIAFFHSHSYSHLGNPIPNGLSCQSNRRMDGLFGWHLAPETGRKDAETTVVLLGWLDGKQKHLRRYVEWYNSQGIHAITFVVEVGELLGSDSRERIERRINALANDITSWVTDDDGQDRRLLFHTFSNTGFLTYAYLIEILLGKAGVTDKVRGCVVDSGGAGLFNHKIWAAGFAAAILKQTSSTTQPDDTKSLVQGVLEKSFAVVLKSPQVDRVAGSCGRWLVLCRTSNCLILVSTCTVPEIVSYLTKSSKP
ncbi:Transmembrane protein 53 [Linum grandiflorum]